MEKKISVKDLLMQAFLTGWELSDKSIAQDEYLQSAIQVIEVLQVEPENVYAEEGLGQRNAAAHDHHVDVGRRPSQVVIAHIAADDESLHALLVGKARNPPEYGIRQRHAATSRVA